MKGKKMRVQPFASSRLLLGLILASLSLMNPMVAAGQSENAASGNQLEHIKLVVLPVAGDGHTRKSKYQLGESPIIQLSLMNQSTQNVPVQIHNRLFQYQFDLLRDGVPVQPKEEIAKKIREEDESRGAISKIILDPVKPNKTAPIEVIRLDDWYDQFQLFIGHYHLTVKYRIANSKQSVIVGSTDFDIVQ